MKFKNLKITLLFTALFMSSLFVGAQMVYQLPNGGFEAWDGTGTDDEPTFWNGFPSANCTLVFGCTAAKATRHEKSSDVRPGSTGSSSCKIFATSVLGLGIIANGNITTGQIHIGSSTATSTSNYNTTLIDNADHRQVFNGKPDSIYFWTKFVCPSSTQEARISAIIHDNYSFKDPTPTTEESHVVGKAIKNFTCGTQEWARHAVAFDYEDYSVTTPAYLLLTFTTNAVAGAGSTSDNLYIDDITFYYNTRLANLIMDGDSIGDFSADVLDYYDTLYYGDSKPVITAITESDNATFSVNDIDSSLTTVVVTSGDASTTYNIHFVYRPVCPSTLTVEDDDNVVLSGAMPLGGVYSGENVIGNNPYTFDPTVVGNGTYDVVYTTDNGSCQYQIIVDFPVVIVSINDVDENITVCMGTPKNDVIMALADSVYVVGSDNMVLSSPLSWSIADYDSSLAQTYVATGIFTLPEGIEQSDPETDLQVTTNVIVSNSLEVSIDGISSICEGTSTELTASGADTYLWSNQETSSVINVSPTSETTYSVVGTSSICTGSAEITVVVNPNPEVSIFGDTVVTVGDSVTLTANGASSYIWNTNDTASSITFVAGSETTFSVVGTDENGCIGNASVEINIADGINDVDFVYSLYPNPANTNVRIASSEMIDRVELVSINGQLIYSSEVNANNANINVQSLIDGIYFVRLYTAKGLSTAKISIER